MTMFPYGDEWGHALRLINWYEARDAEIGKLREAVEEQAHPGSSRDPKSVPTPLVANRALRDWEFANPRPR